jgi:hypothetical protein
VKSKEMDIEDTFFGCGEAPIWIPTTFNYDQLSHCASCTLRLTAMIPGPGTVTTRADGFDINENPQTSLDVNGQKYTLVESIMTCPGAHKLKGADPSVAEVYLYFKHDMHSTKYACVVIPINIGNGSSATYFSTLGDEIRTDRPTVATLLATDAQFLMYDAADTRGRTTKTPAPREFCDPVKRVVTYYVSLTPATILPRDYERLKKYVGAGGGPPTVSTSTLERRLTRLVSIVTGMKIDTVAGQAKTTAGTIVAPTGDGTVSTKQLKCYRIDPKKDIVNNAIYVGGGGSGAKQPGTLADELEASEKELAESETPAAVQPGDIERILGIVLGVIVGVIACATIAYVLWNRTFKEYVPVQQLYAAPAVTQKVAEATSAIVSKPFKAVQNFMCGSK